MKNVCEAPFVKNTEFYCRYCDHHKVHSDRPETGKFFFADGHVWKGVQHKEPIGEHVLIVFAICSKCEVK